jgi:hypothetical protein
MYIYIYIYKPRNEYTSVNDTQDRSRTANGKLICANIHANSPVLHSIGEKTFCMFSGYLKRIVAEV